MAGEKKDLLQAGPGSGDEDGSTDSRDGIVCFSCDQPCYKREELATALLYSTIPRGAYITL